MIKLVSLFSKKPGMSDEDFEAYYETKHVPLVLDLSPRFAGYRRNYVIRDKLQYDPIPSFALPFSFDVMMASWFKDQATLAKIGEDLKDPAKGNRLAADEANFFDRDKMIMFGVEEYVTPAKDMGMGEGAPEDGSMVKIMALLKRKAGMSREAFIDYYENRHVPLALKHFPTYAGYRRSYLIPNSAFGPAHLDHIPPQPDVDVLTEIWFRDKAGYDAFVAKAKDPKIAAMFAADQENMMDRRSMPVWMVKECVTPPAVLQAATRAKGY